MATNKTNKPTTKAGRYYARYPDFTAAYHPDTWDRLSEYARDTLADMRERLERKGTLSGRARNFAQHLATIPDRVEAFLEDNPGLEECFDQGTSPRHREILTDMRDRLNRWGSLTDKQVTFARRLADPEPPAETPPVGRHQVSGTITGFAHHYGLQRTMHVTLDNGAKAHGSCPRVLFRANMGDHITFAATFGAGGWFRQPTKARFEAEGCTSILRSQTKALQRLTGNTSSKMYITIHPEAGKALPRTWDLQGTVEDGHLYSEHNQVHVTMATLLKYATDWNLKKFAIDQFEALTDEQKVMVDVALERIPTELKVIK